MLLRKGTFNDIRYVAGKIAIFGNRAKRRFGACPTAFVHHPPRSESGGEPGRELRVRAVDLQHDPAQKIVARAVRAMELSGISHRERADERSHAIRVTGGKRRM